MRAVSERIALRRARAGDSACIARLDSRFFPYAGLSREQVGYYRRRSPQLVLVATGRDGSIAGYLVCSRQRYREVFSVHVVSMGVVPSRRRRGIGRRLLMAAVRGARRAGADRVRLEVSTRNRAAVGLYRSLGFETKRRRPDYYEPGHNAFVMERRLEPVSRRVKKGS